MSCELLLVFVWHSYLLHCRRVVFNLSYIWMSHRISTALSALPETAQLRGLSSSLRPRLWKLSISPVIVCHMKHLSESLCGYESASCHFFPIDEILFVSLLWSVVKNGPKRHPISNQCCCDIPLPGFIWNVVKVQFGDTVSHIFTHKMQQKICWILSQTPLWELIALQL